eukprot:204852_1
MGCCKSRSKKTSMNDNNVETQTTSIQTSNNSQSLLANSNNNNTQQSSLLNSTQPTDYLSINHPSPQQLIDNTQIDDVDNKDEHNVLTSSNIKCQTPPIIKTLFGNTNMNNISSDDNIPDDNDTDEIKISKNKNNSDSHATPMGMGGNVYLGYADTDSPILFQNINNNIDDESKEDNILASSSIPNHSNSSNSNSSDSGNDSNDWIPSKPANNTQLLMGFMDNNDTITFNNTIAVHNINTDEIIDKDNLLLSLDEHNEMKNDIEDIHTTTTPQYINFNNGERVNVDSMLMFAASSENNAFTSSNMSLASAQMADMVINSSNSNLKGLKSNSSFKLKYMKSIGISTDNILIYGQKNRKKLKCKNTHRKANVFDYGLWIEPESYYNLQDWFQHYTNENLFVNGNYGDGRISPIISEAWNVFKKNMKINNININKFNASNDPFIDLELKIIGLT